MPRGDLNTSLASYFPYDCIVESASKSVDVTGDQIETWSVFSTAKAALAPNEGQEEVESRGEIVRYSHLIMLNGNYDIDEYMRVTIDDIIYEIAQVGYRIIKSTNLDLEFTLLKAKRVE